MGRLLLCQEHAEALRWATQRYHDVPELDHHKTASDWRTEYAYRSFVDSCFYRDVMQDKGHHDRMMIAWWNVRELAREAKIRAASRASAPRKQPPLLAVDSAASCAAEEEESSDEECDGGSCSAAPAGTASAVVRPIEDFDEMLLPHTVERRLHFCAAAAMFRCVQRTTDGSGETAADAEKYESMLSSVDLSVFAQDVYDSGRYTLRDPHVKACILRTMTIYSMTCKLIRETAAFMRASVCVYHLVGEGTFRSLLAVLGGDVTRDWLSGLYVLSALASGDDGFVQRSFSPRGQRQSARERMCARAATRLGAVTAAARQGDAEAVVRGAYATAFGTFRDAYSSEDEYSLALLHAGRVFHGVVLVAMGVARAAGRELSIGSEGDRFGETRWLISEHDIREFGKNRIDLHAAIQKAIVRDRIDSALRAYAATHVALLSMDPADPSFEASFGEACAAERTLAREVCELDDSFDLGSMFRENSGSVEALREKLAFFRASERRAPSPRARWMHVVRRSVVPLV